MTKRDAIDLAIYYKKTTGKEQIIYNTHSIYGYFVGHNFGIQKSTIYKII